MVEYLVIHWEDPHFMENQESVLLTMQYVIKIYSPHVANFIVREPSSLSDHSPIMAWLNIGTNDNHLATKNTNDTLTRLPKQFIWESNSPQKFRAALQSRDIQRMIHDFLVDSGPY